MRYLFIFIFTLAVNSKVLCQLLGTDSLIQLLEKPAEDTNRVKLLLEIANKIFFYKPDISLEYSTKALALSRDLGYTEGILASLRLTGEGSRLVGDYPTALKLQFEALAINRKLKYEEGEATSLGFIGVIYLNLREYHEAIVYLLQSNFIRQKLQNSADALFMFVNMGIAYNYLNKPDSALYYLQLASAGNKEIRHPQLKSLISRSIGQVYENSGKRDSALYYYHFALNNSISSNESINIGSIQSQIAGVYESIGKYDSAFYYSRNAFSNAQRTSQKSILLTASSLLVRIYRAGHNLDSAFFYEDIAAALKDTLYGIEKLKQLQLLMLGEQKKQQAAQQEQERYKNKIKMIVMVGVVGVFLVIASILYRNNRHKQKANKVLETTLSNLKSTQNQLIQSEKMASLGELTAGIAHEIQNPLNFVNNFSEVSRELIDELKSQRSLPDGQAGKLKTEEQDELLNAIDSNLEKINHHGQRAADIVKGMLQHSRSSSGVKESTDINALCDEYLRLSYHGLRAKDKSFNATMKTDFDNSIGNINIVPQDIGRVLLNLINNAFYAVQERETLRQTQGDNDYEPTVSISTKRAQNNIEIKVADNGNGIPQKILDKIFQPFFTTKPTGQGTGLGLSLSYDIVKAHGGELKVETKEGEGTKFIVYL